MLFPAFGSYYRYEAVYAKKLPEFINGRAFIEKYVDHEDPVTIIDQKHSYAVKAPTMHPIYENFRVKVSTSVTIDHMMKLDFFQSYIYSQNR